MCHLRQAAVTGGWLIALAALLGHSPGSLRAAVKSETARAADKKAESPTFKIPQVQFINEQIRKQWEARGLGASPLATDNEWCRRLYLDLLGRVPSVTELNQFTDDTSPEKRLKLVNRLLGDDHIEDYARNWTTIWTNILIGRKGGTERRTLVNRPGMQQALRRAFEKNTTYDKLVYDLITAKGSSKPGEKDFNGFVNFLAGNLADNAIEATAKTSQIFLGVQVRCTQCHNHPFNEWKQNQFWEMNAFFRQTKLDRTADKKRRRDTDFIELSNTNFQGEDKSPKDAALFYELRNGKMAVAYPVFIDGTHLKSNSGYVEQVDRRTELAKMVLKSDNLSIELVNRMWAHFLGYGFTKPIDDLGPHNAASHPELLEGLAKEFRTRSYDLKELIRWITLSEAYALSSHYGEKNKIDDPSLGEKPAFSHFYLRQMRAEELYESLLVATEAHKTRGKYEEQESTKSQWLQQFTLAFGTDDNEETTTFNGTIPQALMMMNGELVKSAINADKGSFLHRISVNDKLNNHAKINYLYMAGLARRPSKMELDSANKLLLNRRGDATAALQDVWWALLNSNEFILNH